MEYRMTAPFLKENITELHAGDTVLLCGTIYTARDAAHRRMADLLAEGKTLPFPLENQCIYYAGPTPAPPGRVIGSVGPTTAGRMDLFTPRLLDEGLAAMIGKGARNRDVMEAIHRNGAVYFGFIGGAGALAAARIQRVEIIAWEDLGSEAVRRLEIADFPLTVLADAHGGDLYREGREQYLAFADRRGN